MNSELINELLGDAFKKSTGFSGTAANLLYSKVLPVFTAEQHISDISKQELETVLAEAGEILERSDEDNTITVIVYAGIDDMNPAVIVAKINEDNSAELAAYAKEGLIKQHTAEDALQKVFHYKNALNTYQMTIEPNKED